MLIKEVSELVPVYVSGVLVWNFLLGGFGESLPGGLLGFLCSSELFFFVDLIDFIAFAFSFELGLS